MSVGAAGLEGLWELVGPAGQQAETWSDEPMSEFVMDIYMMGQIC